MGKTRPTLTKWYVIHCTDLRKIEVLGTPFIFTKYLPIVDIIKFRDFDFIIHKAIYPYNVRKQYTDLYTITHMPSGIAVLSDFEYDDIDEIIQKWIATYGVNNIISTIKEQIPLKKKGNI